MAQEKQETRAEEVARVRSYLASQSMRRTPEQLVETLREAHRQFLLAVAAVSDAAFRSVAGDDRTGATGFSRVVVAALSEGRDCAGPDNDRGSTQLATSSDDLDRRRSHGCRSACAWSESESFHNPGETANGCHGNQWTIRH